MFQNKDSGCCISVKLNLNLISNYNIEKGGIMYEGTSTESFQLASYVISQKSCTNKEYSMIGTDLGITALKTDVYDRKGNKICQRM